MPETATAAPAFEGRSVYGGHKQPADDYKAPVLFPEWRHMRTRDEQMNYVKERLIALAEAKALSVTDLHRQEVPIPDYCGMVIFGKTFNAENQMVDDPEGVPPAVRDYRVTVKSVKRDVSLILQSDHKTPKEDVPERVPIGWKVGKVKAGSIGVAGQKKVDDRWEDAYMESDLYEASLMLSDAWKCLHQNGKHCRPAKRAGLQAKLWLYEEVPPPGRLEDDESEPARRQPFRRRTGRQG